MTSTIQFWIDIILNNILPKMEDQCNPILMDIILINILPKIYDPYNSFLDGYYAQ